VSDIVDTQTRRRAGAPATGRRHWCRENRRIETALARSGDVARSLGAAARAKVGLGRGSAVVCGRSRLRNPLEVARSRDGGGRRDDVRAPEIEAANGQGIAVAMIAVATNWPRDLERPPPHEDVLHAARSAAARSRTSLSNLAKATPDPRGACRATPLAAALSISSWDAPPRQYSLPQPSAGAGKPRRDSIVCGSSAIDRPSDGTEEGPPDGLWEKCDYCGEILYTKELEKRLWVCSKCNYHFILDIDRYIDICATRPFTRRTGVCVGRPLGFKDLKRYDQRSRSR